jgi:hypothetical protein
MDNELMKKMDMQVVNFKKFRDYVDLLDRDVAKNGFLLLDERSYRRNIREFAVKKSEFVALFTDKANLSEWFAQTTPQNKNFLYDLAKNNNFEITTKDLDILSRKENIIPHGYHMSNPVYELNPSYSKGKVESLTSFVKDSYTLEGENHLKVQENAAKVITDSIKNFTVYQKTCNLLHEKFGKHYDDVLSDFKTAVKAREVEQVGNDFIITSKSLDKPQKLKFSVDEMNQISEITTVPPSIKSLNDKFRSQETRPGMKIT